MDTNQPTSIALSPELSARMRSVAVRNRELDATMKSAINAALEIRAELADESRKVWNAIRDETGADIENVRWVADAGDDVVTIHRQPEEKQEPTDIH